MSLGALLLLAVLLVASAACSMTEAAFLAVNKVRLRHLMQRGSPAAQLVYRMLTQLDRLIATILISNNLINVLISVLGTLMCVRLFGEDRGPVVAAIAVTILVLMVGEITPKLFAAAHADRVALLLARPMTWLIRVMRPAVTIFTGVSQGVMRLLGEHRLARSPLMTEEELKVMIEMGREAGVVAERELRMLHKIFEFDDTLVRDVMIPRDQIVGADISQSSERVLDLLVEEGHSRIPVYQGSLDHIVGVLYARDLLAVWRHGNLFVLSDLMRPVYVVAETTRVAELLTDFQRRNLQIAIVRSPENRTTGLVTIEDVLEEIVGELREEIPSRPPHT